MKTKNTDLQKPKKRFFTRDARYPDAYTIDLRYINSRAYCDSRELGGIGDRVYNYFLITMVLLGLGFILSFFVESAFAKSHHGVELSVRDQIRYERLEMCQQAYKESGINKKFIHGQIPAVRCATYLTLIYAYESGFGQSRMCQEQRNCMGMKQPTSRQALEGISYQVGNGRFMIFESERDANLVFARLYWQWHYKKDIETFIQGWSMTDRATYIQFMRSRFHTVHSELETLFF